MLKKKIEQLRYKQTRRQFIQTAAGKAVEIGRGVVYIPTFLSVLLAVGYSGIVAFEYEKDADDPLAGLAESVGYVRGVLAAI